VGPDRRSAEVIGYVAQVRRDPSGVPVELCERRIGALVEQLPRPIEPVRLVVGEMDDEVVAPLDHARRRPVRRRDEVGDAGDPRQLTSLALEIAEPATEQPPAVERENGRAHVQGRRARLVAQPRLRSGQAPVQGERIGVEITSQVAHLGREGHLPPHHLGLDSRRQGQVEDVGSDLVSP
jgi:hypothetical protein